MADQRVRLLVEGLVQGVLYRASAQAEASALGLRGFVRNLADGRVEVVAEGTPAALRALVEWCRKGPPHARVTGVAEEWGPPAGERPGFRVAR